MNKIKQYILYGVIGFISSYSISSASFDYQSINKNFFFTNEYKKDKIQLIQTLSKSNLNKNKKINDCLIFGNKYFGEKYKKEGCAYQIKNYNMFLGIEKHGYSLLGEQNFFFKNNIQKSDFSFYIRNINRDGVSKNELDLQYENIVSYTNTGIYQNQFKFYYYAFEDLNNLGNAYQNDTNKKLYINSGYRSYENQETLYKQYISMYGINQNIAVKQGFSEHNLGIAVDFKNILYVKDGNNNNTYKWLSENAWKYGFIQTYNNSCYGIQKEDWHYRWVGTYISTKWKDWSSDKKDSGINFCNIDFIDFIIK